MSETHTYTQVIPYTDRLNYCSPMINGNGYARAVEQMLGVEIPARAKAVRTSSSSEFSRIMDHMVCIGANLVDLGGLTNFWYSFQAREEIYSLLEACCGARLTSSYARIGGLSLDVPDNFVEWCRTLVKSVTTHIHEVDSSHHEEPDRPEADVRDTGVVTKEQALAWGFTGPCLRASGVAYDVRKDKPYDGYDEVDFDVPVATAGDNFARYLVRMEEMRQSLRIIEQVVAKLPGGPVVSDDYRVVLPPKEMVYNEMEGLIFHFKNVFEGIQVPAGEIYSYTEGANGELGYSIVSDGSGTAVPGEGEAPLLPALRGVREDHRRRHGVRRRRHARDAQHHRRRAGPVGRGRRHARPRSSRSSPPTPSLGQRLYLPAARGDGPDAPEVPHERLLAEERARRSSTRRSGATTPTAFAAGTS